MKKRQKPKYLQFDNCPICDEPFEILRVIRLLSSERKGRYLVWCKNKHKLEFLYRQF